MIQHENNSQDELQILYEVQSIHDRRVGKDGKDEYLVKWEGFKQKTWEPVFNLQNLSEMIYKFNQSQKSLRRGQSLMNHQTAKKNPKKQKIHKQPIQQKTEEKRKKRLTKQSSKNTINQLSKEPAQQQFQTKQALKDNEILISESSMAINQNYQSDDEGPRMKFTEKFQESLPDISEFTNRPPNIYIDDIKRISSIEKRNNKWMVLVQFQESKFQGIWYQRDLIRLLFPEKLLALYERLKKEKTRQSSNCTSFSSNGALRL